MRKIFIILVMAFLIFGQQGGYPGINILNDLDNVNVSNPDTGEALIFDGSKWVADSVSGVDFADSARVASYADSARVSVYADSSRVSVFSDSTSKIDTTYTPLQTYITNHGGSGYWTKSDSFLYPTIYDSLKIGIGTTTPQHKLHVDGNIAVDTIFFSGGDTLFEIPDSVTYAIYADTAQYAVNSDSSVYADTASHALYADTTEYSINSLTSITSDSSVYSVYADTASYSENSDSSIYADTASYATTIDTTDIDFTTYVANNSGGSTFSEWTDFSATYHSVDSLFSGNGLDSIGDYIPIRFRATGGAWVYAVVMWEDDSTGVIFGRNLSSSTDDEWQYGRRYMIHTIPFSINGYWADNATDSLLYYDLNMGTGIVQNFADTAYLVGLYAQVKTEDSGASEPRLNANSIFGENGGMGIEPLIAGTYSGATATTSYKIAWGETIELTTDANGTNNDSQNLSGNIILIVP